MTPAINQAKALQLDFTLHRYTHEAGNTNYGEEAANKLGITSQRIFKTLVVDLGENNLAVVIVPVYTHADLKAVAKHFAVKKVSLADPKVVARSTGYVLGAVSPLGQKNPLPAVIDASAQNHSSIYVSGGKRGLEIELPAQQLADSIAAKFACIAC